jgi:hypothetical protein
LPTDADRRYFSDDRLTEEPYTTLPDTTQR